MSKNELIQTENSCYRLTQQCLGYGTFGYVQKAINLITQQQVAIKVISASDFQMANNQVNILKELNKPLQNKILQNRNSVLINSMSNQSLIFYGTYCSYNQFYIVAQLFGVSLAHIMDKSIPYDYKFVITIFKAIIQAMKPLRQNKILHRDIKPTNILIKQQNQKIYKAKICDFGLSCFQQQNKNSIFSINRVGTLIYQSPQVIKFKQYSQKSQIWSLGIILYELIYKKLPFQIQLLNKSDQLYERLMIQPIKFIGIPLIISKLGQKCLTNCNKKRITFNQLQKQVNQIYEKLTILNQPIKSKINQYTQIDNYHNKNETQQQKTNKKQQFPKIQYSDKSTIQLSISAQSRKNSQQQLQLQQKLQQKQKDINYNFIKLINKLYSQLKIRLQNTKKIKKQGQIKLLNLCDKFIQNNQHQPNKQYVNYFAQQIICNLQQNIKKMQIIYQYAHNQKQIAFNLKQFMLIDTLFILYQVTKQKKQNRQNSTNITKKCKSKLEQHLNFLGQAKSMNYYKDLRQKVLHIN